MLLSLCNIFLFMGSLPKKEIPRLRTYQEMQKNTFWIIIKKKQRVGLLLFFLLIHSAEYAI